jgi:RNA polymerase sigma-70 factor, ECF subfamily
MRFWRSNCYFLASTSSIAASILVVGLSAISGVGKETPVRYDQKSDEVLLQQIVACDQDALETLYDRHSQVVYNLIFRIVKNDGLAQEILQETFWQVWKKAGSYQGGGAPAAWIYRIARNKSLDQLRRQNARPQPVVTTTSSDEQAIWATLAASTSSVEAQVEQRSAFQQLRHALEEIPPEQRLCLELAYFEGMSQSEIAEFTQTPLGTTKTRIRSGLQKLERILSLINRGMRGP